MKVWKSDFPSKTDLLAALHLEQRLAPLNLRWSLTEGRSTRGHHLASHPDRPYLEIYAYWKGSLMIETCVPPEAMDKGVLKEDCVMFATAYTGENRYGEVLRRAPTFFYKDAITQAQAFLEQYPVSYHEDEFYEVTLESHNKLPETL